jgi:hypothetical protein
MLLADKRHTSREFRGAILARAKYSATGLDSPEGNGCLTSDFGYCYVLCLWVLDSANNETPIVQLQVERALIRG